ncbi:helix-turn-helix transcriptional regulator [Streptomyces sp. NPDC005355]|uniref:helix-turn-helix domain-containing protein n=1 Tax=Streptomyces sp. NPDC005355 TaxID=3157038 RepID=UPI0033A752C0
MTIGERIRERRSELGMGQGQLAVKVNHLAGLASGGLTRNEISRYERGLRKPHDWLPFIARALGVSISWLTGAPAPAPLALTDALTQLEQDLGMMIDRRTFLTDSGGLALSVIPSGNRSLKAVPPEAVRYFRRQLDGLWRADAAQSPRQLIPTAAAQFQIVAHLAANSQGDLRRRLWQTAAAFTGLVTWLYQDAGQLDHASTWGTRTLELAHRAHDKQLVAHALANRAMVEMDIGDGPTTVEMASAALADERQLCAKVKVQALQQAAHGHALVGDRRTCDRLLDRAGQLIDRIDDDHPWGNATRTPLYLEIQRATCYSRMQLGAEAVRLWDQVMPSAEWRNSGVFAARQAAALADSRRPDEAAVALEAAVHVAEEVESARLRGELTTAWKRLAPWHHAPQGQAVHALFDGIGLRTAR